MFTKVPKKGGDFPKMAKKVGYSWFGVFMEKFIGTLLDTKTLPTKENLSDFYLFISMQMPPEKQVTEKELMSDFPYFLDIGEWVLESFPKTGKILFEPEWNWGKIQGHPDIVMEKDDEIVIYDVKTTGMFGRMRLETILQLLSYYCLNKVLKIGAKKIGLILPAQKTIIKVVLSGWEWKPFWKELNRAVKDPVDYAVKSEFNTFIEPYYGTHIEKKDGKVWKGLEKKATEYGRRPYQIFISGPRGGQITETTKDEKKTLEIVTKHKLQYFIHTPYIINLCREEGKEKDTKDTETKFKTYTPSEELRRQVDYGVRTGCRGVVIHMGKQVNLDENDAISNMLINIENAAPSATKRCPILLETGSGTEMLSDLKKFIDFYECLSYETKEVTGICLDTCHVFAAGFMPMDAIRLLEEAKIPIKLIHYNDSKCSFGSRKDRHQTIGKGMIPIKELLNVGYWAIKNSVPLVGE